MKGDMSGTDARGCTEVALGVLSRTARAFLSTVLARALARVEDRSARARITAISYGTLRRREMLDYQIRLAASRGRLPGDPLVRDLLRVAAFQLLFLTGVPHYSVVDAAVTIAEQRRGRRLAGFVNALLRRMAGAPEIRLPDPADEMEHLAVAGSIPGWLADRWLKRMGAERALDEARALLGQPPVTLRVNMTATGAPSLRRVLEEGGATVASCRFAREGLDVSGLADPLAHPVHEGGLATAQGESSMLVTQLLDPRPGEEVLDGCAGSGGKTGAILERQAGSGRVTAVDPDSGNASLLQRTSARLGLEGLEVCIGDLSDSELLAPASFDAVLVDAPCTGLGSLLRRPDIKWRRGPDDPCRLATRQRSLLEAAARLVRPGGRMVYAVCSMEPEEGEEVVAWFGEQAGRHFRLEPAEQWIPPELVTGGIMRTSTGEHGLEGFTAARWRRTDDGE